jgi:short-subunit dehydrogenase
MMNVAIVTGASSGLGWEYAKQLAPRREVDEVWLIARRKERLDELAGQLVGAVGRVFPMDLTEPEQTKVLFDTLDKERPTVAWLINNAGFGKIGRFESIDVDSHLSMIDLNVRVLTEITQRALPYCTSGSRIVQVASSAGFAPMGNFAVYAATKAYVINFSNALATELAPHGINVTAVCPGPVATEFQSVAHKDGKDKAPKMVLAQPGDVVRKSLADARKGKLNSVYGATMKAWEAISGLVPRRLAAWTTSKYKG